MKLCTSNLKEYENFESLKVGVTCMSRDNGYKLNVSIGSVHPSESGTITAFWGEKGESQLDEKGMWFP